MYCATKWKRLLGASVLLAVALFCSSPVVMSAAQRGEPISVGMVALLATPQKYNGKIIRTWGFLNLRSDSNALFLHEEDLRVPLLKNSFALQLTPEQEKQFKSLHLSYVVVQGTMHSDGPDGPSLHSGTIDNITLVNGWAPYVPFKPGK